MMIPITRKEKYINEIVGGGDTAPKTPQTREEFFFADILGEVIAPSPITRTEKYLSAIAGQYSGELPEPITRIEFFIARAAGMDVETPTPITREEIFWSNYSAIVDFEVEGVPPLTYKAIEGTLENYRIYGQTVDGESVGDRTGNLFDKTVYLTGGTKNPTVNSNYRHVITGLTPNTQYTLSSDGPGNHLYLYTDNSFSDYNASYVGHPIVQKTDLIGNLYFEYAMRQYYNDFLNGTYYIMLNEGSTPLPYEPYGYKVPVTVSNGTDTLTTPIYLPEQIKKVGDEAEYIDYAEQKLHRIGANDIDVTLPALPTLTGTNVLSVGTEVQPSDVYIKYEGAR